MMFKPMAAIALLGVLGGCALGVDGSSAPRASFQANMPVQDALDAAQEQAKLCLRGKDAYQVLRLPGGNADSGSVVVRAPFTENDIARVDASAAGAGRTNVEIVMWGRSIWDANAVNAMRDAVTFRTPSCKAYMPRLAPTQAK